MSQQQFMQNPWSNWMKGEGPDSDIVISTSFGSHGTFASIPSRFWLLTRRQRKWFAR